MQSPIIHHELLLSRQVSSVGLDPVVLRRSCARGELVRLRPGAYVLTSTWAAAGVDERHRLRIRAAAAASRTPVVVSHVSAAVLHGMPLVGAPPAHVHVLVPPAGGSRHEHGFVKHARIHSWDAQVEGGGLLLTPLAVALVDVCLTESFTRSVVMTDHALRAGAVTLAELVDEFASRGTRRGARKVEAVVAFASPLADRPLESVSRVGMRLLGLPDPELQHEFRQSDRHLSTVDFWWPDVGAVGEADGDLKYSDPVFLAGRTPAQVVIDEKKREDAVRRLDEVTSFVRWDWATALDVEQLGARLAAAGLRPQRGP
ncbi:type IV toxin-antitoxin system AbiEi family antitoxin domain-containing protein [uncultured Frigoribacterium sp.]|uniref:type IV toxin-antitoxin system AbiEi family antitoxin domain-containing protein n=1 Tax=uncultured Frigoribacterium sp. TaxID=335377 RepID=UPI0028D3C04D|nr:type IV toxin-antitoxin system AbiEi family antitoxin domain-containing protein [uncultured Frigoribacterium sp.]